MFLSSVSRRSSGSVFHRVGPARGKERRSTVHGCNNNNNNNNKNNKKTSLAPISSENPSSVAQQNLRIRHSRNHVQCKKSSTDGWRCQEAKEDRPFCGETVRSARSAERRARRGTYGVSSEARYVDVRSGRARHIWRE